MTESVLQRATEADVVMDPYPHLIIKNALPEALAEKLRDEFPELDAFPQNKFANKAASEDEQSNRRLDIPANLVEDTGSISPAWKDAIAYHSSPKFLADFTRVFGDAIEKTYPDFLHTNGRLENMRTGLMGRDESTGAEFLLNASIGVNTPVTTESSRVRGVHIDRIHELYAGLLYLRDAEDGSLGGNFELHKFTGPRGFLKNEVPPNLVKKVTEAKYEHNTLVVFLNTINSLHAVSPRAITPFPRRFMIFSGAVTRSPLIDHSLFQLGNKPSDIRGASEAISLGRLAWARMRRFFERARNCLQ